MLYSVGEGARAGQRISPLASITIPGLAEKMIPILLHSEMDSLSLRNNLAAWEHGLAITEIHREEARFAARAYLKFARRHFNSRTN